MSWNEIAEARRKLAVEYGTVVRDWGGRLPIALIYPHSYYVGMSSLGFQTLYGLLNAAPKIVCERIFAPDPPGHQPTESKGARPRRGTPGAGGEANSRTAKPLSVESQRELSEFAVAAFSVSFELDYFNVVDILRRSGLPLLSAERDARHPLVIAGGPAVTANPEPLSPFVDAFVLGEAEPILPQLTQVLVDGIAEAKETLLKALASLPGVYVPALFGTVEDDDGIWPAANCPCGGTCLGSDMSEAPEAAQPVAGDKPAPAPRTVVRQWARDLDAFATTSVVLTDETELGDMFLIEVSRGCGRGCRFCLAGYIYRPLRLRSVSGLLEQAREGLRLRKRLGLVGAAVSDHPQIDRLIEELRDLGAELSFSSLRLDRLSEPILNAVLDSGTRTITLAPEVGSERLLRLIGKGISRDQVLVAADKVASKGIDKLKLYFMIGLPSETDDDAMAVADLAEQVRDIMDRHAGSSQITLNVSPFVPKAATPFEREPMAELEVLTSRLRRLQERLRRRGMLVKGESPEWAVVQAVLARGDRRTGEVLTRMESNSLSAWRRAFRASGLDQRDLVHRQIPKETVLPWYFIENRFSGRRL